VPLLAVTFFSPGMSSEGWPAFVLSIFAATTLVGLTVSAIRRRWIWTLVALQAALIALALYETLSQALYIGT